MFKPTWLYLKQHNTTGLKYFGKTVRDPEKYFGSGVRWTNHLEKHGYDVSTIWKRLFTSEEELVQFALEYSKVNNIVESTDYANLIPEDGKIGGDTGLTKEGRNIIRAKSKAFKHSEESKEKIRAARKLQVSPRLGKPHTEESKEKIRQKRALQVIPVGRTLSEETKRKISESKRIRNAARAVS
jgi:hypothetical protein